MARMRNAGRATSPDNRRRLSHAHLADDLLRTRTVSVRGIGAHVYAEIEQDEDAPDEVQLAIRGADLVYETRDYAGGIYFSIKTPGALEALAGALLAVAEQARQYGMLDAIGKKPESGTEVA
jgi:hypothetical protein